LSIQKKKMYTLLFLSLSLLQRKEGNLMVDRNGKRNKKEWTYVHTGWVNVMHVHIQRNDGCCLLYYQNNTHDYTWSWAMIIDMLCWFYWYMMILTLTMSWRMMCVWMIMFWWKKHIDCGTKVHLVKWLVCVRFVVVMQKQWWSMMLDIYMYDCLLCWCKHLRPHMLWTKKGEVDVTSKEGDGGATGSALTTWLEVRRCFVMKKEADSMLPVLLYAEEGMIDGLLGWLGVFTRECGLCAEDSDLCEWCRMWSDWTCNGAAGYVSASWRDVVYCGYDEERTLRDWMLCCQAKRYIAEWADLVWYGYSTW
jgi:hypothetical protein